MRKRETQNIGHWIDHADIFVQRFNVEIALTPYTNRFGDNLLIELNSQDDKKSIANIRLNAMDIELKDIETTLHRLYDRLPSTRRKFNELRRHFKCR